MEKERVGPATASALQISPCFCSTGIGEINSLIPSSELIFERNSLSGKSYTQWHLKVTFQRRFLLETIITRGVHVSFRVVYIYFSNGFDQNFQRCSLWSSRQSVRLDILAWETSGPPVSHLGRCQPKSKSYSPSHEIIPSMLDWDEYLVVGASADDDASICSTNCINTPVLVEMMKLTETCQFNT